MTQGIEEPVEVPGRVLTLLRREASLTDRLEDFADRQRRLARSDEPLDLTGLLAERQRVSAELIQIGHRLAWFRSQRPEGSNRWNPEERREAERLSASTIARLRRIVDGDQSDLRLLEVRRRRTIVELDALRSARAATGAYQSRRFEPGRCPRLDECP